MRAEELFVHERTREEKKKCSNMTDVFNYSLAISILVLANELCDCVNDNVMKRVIFLLQGVADNGTANIMVI